MSNVVEWRGVTRLDHPVERIIERAANADLSEVVVLGFDGDGDFFFASSKANGPDVLWLLEMAKIKLMKAGGVE